MPTISGPNRICKKFREFKRALKVRTGDSSGLVTVSKGGWEGEPREEGGWRRQAASQRGSVDLQSAPATPAPCLVLWSYPIPLPDALPMLRGGLQVRAPPFFPHRVDARPSTQNPPSHGGRTGLGSGLREGSGGRGQFTRRVTASVHGLGPREPMARTRTLR